MAEAYSEIIKDPKQTPDWLVEGATNLLPKKEETLIPKNYRPIACLPTTFKTLTSVNTDRLYSHLEKEAIMTPEQRGGKCARAQLISQYVDAGQLNISP